MVKKVPANNELHIVDPPKKFKNAYPISTFTYCIVPHGAPQKAELAEFIIYAMTTGQKYGPALDFAPLPKVVLNAAQGLARRSLGRTPSGGGAATSQSRHGVRAVPAFFAAEVQRPRRRPGRRGGAGRR